MKRFFVCYDGRDIEVCAYDPSKHRGHKFLYFVDGDSELLLVGNNEIGRHDWLLEFYEAKTGLELDKKDLRGAGEIGHDEPVRGWRSESYKLNTPPNFHSRIIELLGKYPFFKTLFLVSISKFFDLSRS